MEHFIPVRMGVNSYAFGRRSHVWKRFCPWTSRFWGVKTSNRDNGPETTEQIGADHFDTIFDSDSLEFLQLLSCWRFLSEKFLGQPLKPLANHSFPLKMAIRFFFWHHFLDTPHVYFQHVSGIYLEVRPKNMQVVNMVTTNIWVDMVRFSLFNISSRKKNMLAIRVISCRVPSRLPMIWLDTCCLGCSLFHSVHFAGSECAQREEIRRPLRCWNDVWWNRKASTIPSGFGILKCPEIFGSTGTVE